MTPVINRLNEITSVGKYDETYWVAHRIGIKKADALLLNLARPILAGCLYTSSLLEPILREPLHRSSLFLFLD